jgi:hypothetical protein
MENNEKVAKLVATLNDPSPRIDNNNYIIPPIPNLSPSTLCTSSYNNSNLETQNRISLLMDVAKLPGLNHFKLEAIHNEIFRLLNLSETF